MRIGSFNVDASVANNVAPGFVVKKDQSGTRTTLTVTALLCQQQLFESTLVVTPPDQFLNETIEEYRISDGAYVDGSELLDHYMHSGLGVAYSAATIDQSETPVGGNAVQGQVTADTQVAEFTLDWARTTSTQDVPQHTVRTFVQDNQQQPPALLGYCDETWSARTLSGTGAAALGSDIPLTALFIPPGTLLAYDSASVFLECRPVQG